MLDFDHNATLCHQKTTENALKNKKDKELDTVCRDYLKKNKERNSPKEENNNK